MCIAVDEPAGPAPTITTSKLPSARISLHDGLEDRLAVFDHDVEIDRAPTALVLELRSRRLEVPLQLLEGEPGRRLSVLSLRLDEARVDLAIFALVGRRRTRGGRRGILRRRTQRRTRRRTRRCSR